MKRWVDGFAYADQYFFGVVDLSGAGLTALVISMLTIGFQAVKAAYRIRSTV